MSEVAPGSMSNDATGLEAAVMAEEAAARETAVVDKKPENTPAPDGGKSDNAKKPSSEPSGEDGSEPTEPDKGTDPAAPPPKEGGEPKDKELKIGTQTFATPEDALTEATRIIGHNAWLAGQNKNLETKAKDSEARAQELQTQLDAAIKANEDWKTWYQEYEKGEDGKPPVTESPDDIADKVAEKLGAKERQRQALAEMHRQLDVVTATPNYAEVFDIFEKVSDKINPLTGQYYTPLEAYSFACKHLGLEEQLRKEGGTEAPKEPAPPEPKKPQNPMKVAAARPAAGAAPRNDKKVEHSEADDLLDEAFPTL